MRAGRAIALRLAVLVAAWAAAGCEDEGCASDADCPAGNICLEGICYAPVGDTDTDTDVDSDSDTDSDTDSDADGDTDADTDVDSDADSDVDADGDGDADGDADADIDGEPWAGGFGDPCQNADDCESRICIGVPGENRAVCSRSCVPGDCPDGTTCRNLAAAGEPESWICVPLNELFCRSCQEDGDCFADLICRTVGSEDHCVSLCSDSAECPPGYACQTSGSEQQCRPEGDTCTGCNDPDSDGYGVGPACAGADCDEGDPQIHAWAPERCNGLDDDCDGSAADDCDDAACEGQPCGPVSYGGWSSCSGFDGTCDETGTRTRESYTPTCVAGVCQTVVGTDQGDCTRDTDGQSCGAVSYGSWGSCRDFSGDCDETGTQYRDKRTPQCSGGTCRDQVTQEQRDCTRDTDGDRCGSNPTYCGAQTTCHVCQGGDCVLNADHFDASCNPSCGHAGNLCGVSAQCCSALATCPDGLVGATKDCGQCCKNSCE